MPDQVDPDLIPNPFPVNSSPSHHRPKKKKSRPRVHIRSPSHQTEEPRGISPTETVYPDPDSAQRAFEEERANNAYRRRAPTPYSRRRSNSVGSNRSDRSDRSGRSHRSRRSRASEDSETTIGPGPGPATERVISPFEPHFGAARGIGPAGEAIEVIGLGRKEPRHRKYGSHLLKPALRSINSVASGMPRYEQDGRRERHRRHHSHGPSLQSNRYKALPGRPNSYIVPVDDIGSSGFRYVSQGFDQPALLNRQHSRAPSRGPSSIGGLRGLFSSLNLDTSHHESSWGPRPPFGRRGSSRRAMEIVVPADDLFTYLRTVDLPPWTGWPHETDTKRSTTPFSALWTGSKAKGYDQMPWGWHRRLEAAENGRQSGRMLMAWESSGKHWERKVLEC